MTTQAEPAAASAKAPSATYVAEGSPSTILDEARADELIAQLLDRLPSVRRVLLIPPDYTRHQSWAGVLTSLLYRRLAGSAEVAVLPALGTHEPMPKEKRHAMFQGVPDDRFIDHRWREDILRLGEVDADYVEEVSGGAVRYPIPIEVNRLLVEGNWDRIFSIGQLVPHEVIGIANHVKNVLIGVGGQETIHKSHYLGAVFGMERIMGQADSPVRAVLQEGMNRFGASLPITYLLTVRGWNENELVTRGLFAGDGTDCYQQGARLSQQVNVIRLERAPKKVVVWLDPEAYHSTWLGNKAIYRTRMAIADGGELIVLAPGVRVFGEDAEIDALIRQFGYRGTPATVQSVERDPALAGNLAAAAHLIHGSSEGRFQITYATQHLSREEVEQVGFRHRPFHQMHAAYPVDEMAEGWNWRGGEEFYFIKHPGQGLWMAETGKS